MTETQRRYLEAVERMGREEEPCTAPRIAAGLGVTRICANAMLARMERSGLVRCEPNRARPGALRPRYRGHWTLTDVGRFSLHVEPAPDTLPGGLADAC